MRLGNLRNSEFIRLLLHGTPKNYPLGHPVEGPDHIPRLTQPSIEYLPTDLCAFNDLGRSISRPDEVVHFYKSDVKFAGILRNPKPFGFKTKDFMAVLTPDVTIGAGMPEWMRKRNTVLSRMCGVAWQYQGLTVIPSLRWVELSDLNFVTAGIEVGSVIAVSSYGSNRNPTAKNTFERGLQEIVNKIQPRAVMVYGGLDQRVAQELVKSTELRLYRTDRFRKRELSIENTEFEGALF
jgi:hypothetical protein